MLTNAADQSLIGELTQARSRSLQLVHNKPGSASFTTPIDDIVSSVLYPLTHGIKAYRQGSSGAWQLIWSGMVWTINEDVTGQQLQVDCVGWMQMLEKRLLRRVKQYTALNNAGAAWTDADIILDLMNDANATTITWDTNHPSNYIVPVRVGASPATPTLITSDPTSKIGSFPAAKNRIYTIAKGANIAQEIQRLVDIENGSDVWLNPGTRKLFVYDKKMTDRPNTVFGYNWGPNNLKQLARSFDPSSLVNYLYVVGADIGVVPAYADTQGVTFPSPTTNPPLMGDDTQEVYGLWEETAALSDGRTTDILLAYAGSEVLLRSIPRQQYTLTPIPWTSERTGNVPEPFVDYDLGDKVYFSARTARRVSIQKQGVRVFGINVGINDDGNEEIGQLQVSP